MNKVFLMGNLTFNPDFTTTSLGVSRCRFKVAVNRYDANGERLVSYIRCVAFGKLAERINTYCKKGDKVLVTGMLDAREYTRSDSTKAEIVEVLVNEIEFLTKSVNNTTNTNETSTEVQEPATLEATLNAIDSEEAPF